MINSKFQKYSYEIALFIFCIGVSYFSKLTTTDLLYSSWTASYFLSYFSFFTPIVAIIILLVTNLHTSIKASKKYDTKSAHIFLIPFMAITLYMSGIMIMLWLNVINEVIPSLHKFWLLSFTKQYPLPEIFEDYYVEVPFKAFNHYWYLVISAILLEIPTFFKNSFRAVKEIHSGSRIKFFLTFVPLKGFLKLQISILLAVKLGAAINSISLFIIIYGIIFFPFSKLIQKKPPKNRRLNNNV